MPENTTHTREHTHTKQQATQCVCCHCSLSDPIKIRMAGRIVCSPYSSSQQHLISNHLFSHPINSERNIVLRTCALYNVIGCSNYLILHSSAERLTHMNGIKTERNEMKSIRKVDRGRKRNVCFYVWENARDTPRTQRIVTC